MAAPIHPPWVKRPESDGYH